MDSCFVMLVAVQFTIHTCFNVYRECKVARRTCLRGGSERDAGQLRWLLLPVMIGAIKRPACHLICSSRPGGCYRSATPTRYA